MSISTLLFTSASVVPKWALKAEPSVDRLDSELRAMKWGTSSLNFGRRPWPLSARLYPAYGVSVDAQFASDRSEGEPLSLACADSPTGSFGSGETSPFRLLQLLQPLHPPRCQRLAPHPFPLRLLQLRQVHPLLETAALNKAPCIKGRTALASTPIRAAAPLVRVSIRTAVLLRLRRSHSAHRLQGTVLPPSMSHSAATSFIHVLSRCYYL